MEEEINFYESPFNSRYSSKEMLTIFSKKEEIKIWRKLWVALAKAEKELGLPISEEQIKELEENINIINYETAKKREKIVKHDVMAQIYAYGELCPNAKKIIHLGATSCYVTDNSSIIIMKKGLKLIKKKLLNLIKLASNFVLKYKSLPCLAYTHLQPAQLTTVGKRAALWLQDFCMDFESLNQLILNLKLLGSKGATGTQASFLKLFQNDKKKVKMLEEKIKTQMGFSKLVHISGQTYSRKLDYKICSTLCEIAQSAMKFSGDMRILQGFKELEEPFEENQIGSSAMPYKKNPMKSERICSIARYVIVNCLNPSLTAATQWFERTLDDSANRRIVIPEIFLAVDSILSILLNIFSGIIVNSKVIEKRVLKELPFMAVENIMMTATKKGGNRQKIHKQLRNHCLNAAFRVKLGEKNNLIETILKDPAFKFEENELNSILKPKNFIGLSVSQVEDFLNDVVSPILRKNENLIDITQNFELLV